LVAGFVLAMIFGMMDQTIKNPEQVDSFFDKSMLGVIPLVKDKIPDEPLYSLLESKEHTDLAEAFRLARANLPYLCPDAGKDGQGARVFLFTSTAKSEGKSNCIASLAYLTASAGKKVLLIDSDLRRPMLGKIFDQSHSQHGIVTYLTGESSWDDALVRDVANLPLDVLPCSKPLPPNPSEILMSNSFSEMIRRERANYDYIFIDGAPALFLADPLIVVPMADAVVFVIACSRAKIGLIRQTLRQIAQISEKTPIGLLVNRFDRSDISCKYGYYRYKDYDRYYHYQKSYYVSDTQE
ncbi:MAG: CpsD/CapB family tyrosine-protein kinase, partial [Lentisphaeria bacterium]|nr:CpsD/CapB family tyrosine-protein kinase [Lentisphaeria bacterium]